MKTMPSGAMPDASITASARARWSRRIDEVEQPRSGRAQVRVAQVQQHALGRRVLGGAHGTPPLAPHVAVARAT